MFWYLREPAGDRLQAQRQPGAPGDLERPKTAKPAARVGGVSWERDRLFPSPFLGRGAACSPRPDAYLRYWSEVPTIFPRILSSSKRAWLVYPESLTSEEVSQWT